MSWLRFFVDFYLRFLNCTAAAAAIVGGLAVRFQWCRVFYGGSAGWHYKRLVHQPRSVFFRGGGGGLVGWGWKSVWHKSGRLFRGVDWLVFSLENCLQ